MVKFIDDTNRFVELFDKDTGFYIRSGVIDENGKDTGVDPFMRCFPALIDVGIMNRCVCAHKCNVDCYQRAIDRTGSNMSIEDYKSILEQCKGRTFQYALGGAGDPDTHENFKEILELSKEYGIVPNFTTSGIMMTEEKAQLCKEYCGAVAVSEHFADYTRKAIDMLLAAGVKTNIHYVLGADSIDYAIEKLKNGGFDDRINAVVFLLYKPIGLGRKENILTMDNPKVQEFFELVDKGDYPHKIGFDSCSCGGIVNFSSHIDMNSIDFCEGGRYSMYIDSNMNAMPCSFGNQDKKYFVSLREYSIEEAWYSGVFNRFRSSLKNSCPNCEKRECCGGGCPICRDIVLCLRNEKELV